MPHSEVPYRHDRRGAAKAPPSSGGSGGGSPSLQLVIMGVSGSGKSTVAALIAGGPGAHSRRATISIPRRVSPGWPPGAQRLAARRGHFIGPELLASQYATLEP